MEKLAFSTLFVGIVAALSAYYRMNYGNYWLTRGAEGWEREIFQGLDEVDWIDTKGSQQVLRIDYSNWDGSLEKPVILYNHPGLEWPAYRNWQDLEKVKKFLPSTIKELACKGKSERKIILNRYNYILGNTPDDTNLTGTVSDVQYLNMSSERFLYGDKLCYIGADPEKFHISKDELGEPDFLFVKKFDVNNNTPSCEGCVWTLWMSRGGNTAGLHYDNAYNFNFQIRGWKRFMIFAPEYWQNMHIYPHLHPHHRQSQRDGILANGANETSGSSSRPVRKLKGLIADVGPGDLLYIPPGYFHRVQIVKNSFGASRSSRFGLKTELDDKDMAIALNGFSPGIAAEIRNSLLQEASPSLRLPRFLQSKWSGSNEDATKRVNMLALFVRKLIREAFDTSDDREYMRKVVQSKYFYAETVAKAYSCPMRDWNAKRCPQGKQNDEKTKLSSDQIEETIRCAKNIGEPLSQYIKSGEVSRAFVEIILQDFIEVIAEITLTRELACLFQACLASPEVTAFIDVN